MKCRIFQELQKALNRHLTVTEEHVSRLEHVFEILGKNQAKCDAMEGLTKRGEGYCESTDPGTHENLRNNYGLQES